MKANLISMLAAVAAGSVFATVPTVSNVSLVQSDDTHQVTITYDLDVEGIVIAEILTNGASIGWANIGQMAGAVNRQVAGGTGKQIWWRPGRNWPEGGKIVSGTMTARVTAYPVDNPPDYMVADLTGTQQKFYYPCEDAIPRGIGDRLYRTDMMVFRKIPAAGATFRLGLPWWGGTGYIEGYNHPHRVTLTNDFWLGVFPVTQGQAFLVHKLYPSTTFTTVPSYSGEDAELCPLDNLSGQAAGFGFATRKGIDDYSLESAGLLATFRHQLGVDTVITPTIAEWEFACQAGSEEPVYGGYTIDEVAWYADNSEGRVHPVGLKKPNAFGLYDMLGNVSERTRESAAFQTSQTESIAPFNAANSHGSYLALLGGQFDSTVVNYEVLAVGSNRDHFQTTCQPGWGIRLYIPLK